MGRKSKRDVVTEAVRDYLAEAEMRSADTHPLDVGSVAAAVGCARSSIYNYGLQDEILAAAQKQCEREQVQPTGLKGLIQQLRNEIAAMETRNLALLERLNLVEANAVRLGVDPEDLYHPLLKPPRQVPRTGGRQKR
jgi:hypothetical protein